MNINAKVTDTDAKAIHIVRNHWWNVFDDELKELAEQAETTPAWYKDGKIDWSWFDQLDESSIKQFGPFTCALTYHGTPMVKHDSDADFTEIDGDCVNQHGDVVIYKPGAILVYHDKTNTFILHKL